MSGSLQTIAPQIIHASHSWPNQRDVATYYGNPDPAGNGVPDRAWEDANLTRIVPPYRMVLAWAEGTPVKSILIHKKCAESLSRVLGLIQAIYVTQAKIEEARMHLYGGAYNFRLKRGGTTLSMHSYGCAIDLDPDNNRFGRVWRDKAGMMPKAVIDIFQAEGWTSGAFWSYPDPMHFQLATV